MVEDACQKCNLNIKGRHLFDPYGEKAILRGINKMSVWDTDDPTGSISFLEIRKTGANSVRIVWAMATDQGPTDSNVLDALITNALNNQLIPMVALHDATGDWNRLQELVNYWVQPAIVEIIQKHQAYLLVNIGNEVGDIQVTKEQFVAGYTNTIQTMRDAGIHTPLVIDAPDFGKNLGILDATAATLINADPEKNLLFSVHLYWSKSCGADAEFIRSHLRASVDKGYPFIVGEFSQFGGFPAEEEPNRSICGPGGEIDYRTIIEACQEFEIGWYAWEWGPGNNFEYPLCAVMDMTPDRLFDHLHPGWAEEVAISSPFSIKNTSVTPASIRRITMPAEELSITKRADTLSAVLSKNAEKKLVETELHAAKGDWSVAHASLETKLAPDAMQKVDLAHKLADWSGDHVPVVKALAKQPDVMSLRDVALNFNVDKLAALVDAKSVPDTIPGATENDKSRNFAVNLRQKLFTAEPTAVLQRMVQDAEVPIADETLRTSVSNFLSNQTDFNIRKTSVYTALKHPEAFKDIADDQRADVIEQVKTLQRVQAISPVPEAMPILMKANLTSAFHVGELPESTFLSTYSKALGEETARQVYTNAINSRIRNEQALITMREAVRGTGLAIIDGKESPEARIMKLQEIANQQEVPLNLETLFGMDYCECDECSSVYSPAAYFVELLQFLRNNNLGADPASPDPDPAHNKNIHPKITGTPLEKLFRRRPDLGCLELTCKNTFTVLPYIDLVNEVMESFVVHRSDYHNSNVDPNQRQARLEAFNVEDETSGELLAQPQHTNYQAYCILKNAVYPFTLPYHQPIDATRISLKYLGTSRYELLDTYRAATETCPDVVLSPAEQQELQGLHQTVIDRAVDAEFLGMTQEEYIILTKEAFWPKRYFDITDKTNYTEDKYRQEIKVKPVHEYYYGDGSTEADLQELALVKEEFLKRTGIQYIDLVELLKTRFINPNYPQGKALAILESIRFSYRFLQTLVDTSSNDPQVRFAKLIEFLEKPQTLLPALDALLQPNSDPCKQKKADDCLDTAELRKWVYCYFERIGKLIVLDSGEGPQLPIEGHLFTPEESPEFVGTLHPDGTITDASGESGAIIGYVTATEDVVWVDGTPFGDKFGSVLDIRPDENGERIGYIDDGELLWLNGDRIKWLPVRDTCNLDNVRLIHLDGTPVMGDEYDCIHRFIRLWRKMGWTIDETDKALVGLSLSSAGSDAGTPDGNDECQFIGFEAFKDDCFAADGGGCDDRKGENDLCCPDIPQVSCEITPAFLHELVAVRKVLDLTGLPLSKLLTFWADISTAGEKSLYSRLFLTDNLLGIDKVFKPDANGNYLTQPAIITDHIPVIMAALNLKADDITTIMRFRKLSDELTLSNVSVLYRHSLLAKTLHVRMVELFEVIALFGDPFKNAWNTHALLESWGKMEDAGFTFRQLNYIIQNHDDPLRPLAPSKRTILQLTKTLYDGLNAIDHDHPEVKQPDEATAELVRTKTSLLFESPEVERILGLLEGTTVYSAMAPVNLAITISEALASKLKYINQKDVNPPRAAIQITGILTDDEKTTAKKLSSHSDWAKAIDRVGKQALSFFNDVLFGIFPSAAEAMTVLLAGDVNVPPDPQNPGATDINTAPGKRLYFLEKFIPFLRKRLTHRFFVDTLAGASGLARDMTDVLVSDLLLVGNRPRPAETGLLKIKETPVGSTMGWKGYLIPPIDDEYTFVVNRDTQPAPISIDGQPISFPNRQEDPSDDIWSSHPVNLKSGKLYWLEWQEEIGQPIDQLQWKTAVSPKAPIPTSALLPDYSSRETEEVFTKLYKAGLLINGFGLSIDEITYWQTHSEDFDQFNLNQFTLQHWRRLQAYTNLRNNLPKTKEILLELFKWAGRPDDPTKLSEKIVNTTPWKKENIEKLITATHLDLNHPAAFRNEVNLVKLQRAVAIADKIGVDIDRLFEWAKPVSKFWVCHQIAEDIRKATRTRFDQEDWEQAVRPLNDHLRENQKQALISYLLVQQDLRDWNVVDADSLFEFFLIDVQMDACMETSRIKQAISSVQLFVQRCLLGLEDKVDQNNNQVGVPADLLDRDRWEWMQRYRVWEANRKVFLYPENWIEPQLRDDKSPFYKELESELLQKDISKQTVEEVIRNYLFKVGEVANLKVVGLFLEQEFNKDGTPALDADNKPIYIKLHVFSRTRSAPYFFYYRYFNVKENNWYSWEKMQVDIPSYDYTHEFHPPQLNPNFTFTIIKNGTYLIPIVLNKRLLVFFPQFTKSTALSPTFKSKKIKDIGEDSSLDDSVPNEYWEIKMAWSEYRNGKWMQKQVSAEAIYDLDPVKKDLNILMLPSIFAYQFVPRLITGTDSKVVIDVYIDKNVDRSPLGSFSFAGNQLSRTVPILDNKISGTIQTDFHYSTDNFLKIPNEIHSLQAIDSSPPSLVDTKPFFNVYPTTVTVHLDKNGTELNFYHPFAHQLLSKLTTNNLDSLFAYYHNGIVSDNDKADAFGADAKVVYHELKRAYSLYNWEVGFHAPMLIVDRLLKAQQFEQAVKMCHYIFNPLEKGTDEKRYWQFPPFKEIEPKNVLEKLLLGLQDNTPDNTPNQQINEWRDKPFQPHVVARARPSSYMKWVVMKYIEILVAWGDYLFRQDTIETINQAAQLYVLAAHIYGTRGQRIPKRGKIRSQTYNSLVDKWDAFSNAMVELEMVFPFDNQTPLPFGMSNDVVGLANIFGFASTFYFCIPDNPKLRDIRNTIDDRLFKIRHCQNIEGVFRQLPLFEPPIEPGLLVQAVAQGLSLASVLNELNSPMPNYRFYYLLQKALELCTELKALGNAFLSVKEKSDAEALSRLRAKHESSIHNLVMEVRKQQLEEAERSLESLQQNRKGPAYRLQHYLKLIGEDLGKVPDENTDFGELPNQIEQPIDESGLKLIHYEKEEMDKAGEAKDWQVGIGAVETLASVLHIIPTVEGKAQPLGIGIGVAMGGTMFGNAAQAVARGLQIQASDLSYQSSSAGRKSGFLRQLQDRVQQANIAGYEIKNIDKQILTQQIRINIANQEITNQQKQIDNAQEIEDFLRSKYTNQELYLWMEDQIRTLYHQAYILAYDLAKKAEKVFRFERGSTAPNFIQFGYWDAAHDGLLAGERLYIGLKQLESAYQEKRGYDFEVSKPISLRQLNPLALLQLRETGTCEFALPEVLFDMDHPGHYMRRIKSVALTIPCVVGPYTSLNCTLRLLEHKFRVNAVVNGKSDYPEKTDGTEDRFNTVNVPITSIAISTGQNDSGVFELNFRDERYLPFEGAGAISRWRLELPSDFRQFDYDSITDVIMQLRYTAIDGGDKLKTSAAYSVNEYIKNIREFSQQEGLFAAFDLRHDFPNEWHKATQPPEGAAERLLSLNNLFERLPIFAKGRQPAKVQASGIYLLTSAALSASTLVLTQGTGEFTFTDGPPIGTMKSFVVKDISIPMTAWQLKIQNTSVELDKLWLVLRYVLS